MTPTSSQTQAQTLLPVSDIDAERRQQIVDGLNRVLANLIEIGVSSKQAHWNVRGPNFMGLHELFDMIAEEAYDFADTVAERVRAFNQLSHGTIQDVIDGSVMMPFPSSETNNTNLTQLMHQRLITVTNCVRTYADNMDDEIATQDVYIEILRGLEKRAWMLEAHLTGAADQ